ncbi:hypothetical protein [Streptomyces sp. NPDC048312]|uniref:hypothetical protein n=1 Tax=Streptomyces sp. NPDC048312 TaxID=3155485 RepID=UPI00340D98BF
MQGDHLRALVRRAAGLRVVVLVVTGIALGAVEAVGLVEVAVLDRLAGLDGHQVGIDRADLDDRGHPCDDGFGGQLTVQ